MLPSMVESGEICRGIPTICVDLSFVSPLTRASCAGALSKCWLSLLYELKNGFVENGTAVVSFEAEEDAFCQVREDLFKK